MNHSWKGKPKKPWAGLTFNCPVYFFIGFHDFTSASALISRFCSFIGLSDFSLQEDLKMEKDLERIKFDVPFCKEQDN